MRHVRYDAPHSAIIQRVSVSRRKQGPGKLHSRSEVGASVRISRLQTPRGRTYRRECTTRHVNRPPIPGTR